MTPTEAVEYLKGVPEDEPVFVLRAKDLYAPSAIASWAGIVQSPISSQKPASPSSALKARRAFRLAKEMRAWQEEHPESTKIPD